MKICKQCGKENPDESMFCHECGIKLEDSNNDNAKNYDFNPGQQSDYNQTYNQQDNYQQQYNTQQKPYQTYQAPNQKNMWIAIILNVVGGLIIYLLSGIGHFYLGLYKRGLIICAIGFIISLIGAMIILVTSSSFMGSLISLVLGLVLVAYSAYDAYTCTNAINQGQSIPPLFGVLDIE